jgi:chromosome segregation ATPase
MGYAASLNVQLNSEKAKTMQLSDQVAGFNATVNDLQMKLGSATANANSQTDLVNSLQGTVSSLQSSLDAANAELTKLKTAYADLESKLKAQIPVNLPQPEVK